MSKSSSFYLIIFLFWIAQSCQNNMPVNQGQPLSTVKCYLLCGQSNMEGFGFYRDIPLVLKNRFEDVYIFHGNIPASPNERGGAGTWRKLQPGHGAGFRSNGEKNFYSDRFGPELGFAQKLKSLQPNTRFALIKYVKSGTALTQQAGPLGYWDPTDDTNDWDNHFSHLSNTVRTALTTYDINRDGQKDELIPAGVIWVQGESDAAYDKASAKAYQRNLTQLIKGFREMLNDKKLPVVLSKTIARQPSQLPYLEDVVNGQKSYAKEDPYTVLVDLENELQFLRDGLHYNSESYLVLGEKLAIAIHDLERVRLGK